MVPEGRLNVISLAHKYCQYNLQIIFKPIIKDQSNQYQTSSHQIPVYSKFLIVLAQALLNTIILYCIASHLEKYPFPCLLRRYFSRDLVDFRFAFFLLPHLASVRSFCKIHWDGRPFATYRSVTQIKFVFRYYANTAHKHKMFFPPFQLTKRNRSRYRCVTAKVLLPSATSF